METNSKKTSLTVHITHEAKEAIAAKAREEGAGPSMMVELWAARGCPLIDSGIRPDGMHLLKAIASHDFYAKRGIKEPADVIKDMIQTTYGKMFPCKEDEALDKIAKATTGEPRFKNRVEQYDMEDVYRSITAKETEPFKDEAHYYHKGLVSIIVKDILRPKLLAKGYSERTIVNDQWRIEKFVSGDEDFIEKFQALGWKLEIATSF